MAPHSSTLAWKILRTEEPGRAVVHGAAKSRTRLSDFTFTFHCHALEKEMATHSSVLAWRIPRTRNLVGCSLWGRTESDMTEVTQQQQQRSRANMRGQALLFPLSPRGRSVQTAGDESQPGPWQATLTRRGQPQFSLQWPPKTPCLVGLDGFMLLMGFVSIILTNQFSTWLPERQLHSK